VAQLNTEAIAAAAFGVLVRGGVEGFSMRAVAASLSVTPMALYNHVRDKAGLAELVINVAFDQNPLPPPTGDWREDLYAAAHWMLEGGIRQPALLKLQRAYRIWTPRVCDVAERWVSLWQQSGLDLDHVSLGAYTSGRAIGGLLVYRELVSKMPKADLLFPAEYDFATKFELGVRWIIEGLHTRLSADKERRIAVDPAKRNVQRPE
jgi:AcrR family transcriptional regulator